MSLQDLLEPTNFLRLFALALSIFNLIAFLWLAFTVWLNGDRRNLIVRVGVIGLSCSALCFFIHALLITTPLTQESRLAVADFLWRLIWLPTLAGPYIWFVIGLHYASLLNEKWRHRRPLLLLCSGLLGSAVLVLLILNNATSTFKGTLRLLAYSDIPRSTTHVSLFSPLILLPVLFLCYVTFCAIGPWFTPTRVGRLLLVLWHVLLGRIRGATLLRKRLADAFWDDQTPVELLEEPIFSWYLARPGLLLAALLMVALMTGLGGLGIWLMFKWVHAEPAMVQLPAHAAAPEDMAVIPLNLIMLDLWATGSLSIIVLLLGYSIVRHGILIERPLARRGFFEQWRGVVIVATAVAIFLTVYVAITLSTLSGLLMITMLATGAYALFTWSHYTAHDRYIAMLGPFLRSTNSHHWLNTDLQKTEQSMEDLFFHLCHDVLDVQCARLSVLARPVRRDFSYRWPLGDAATGSEHVVAEPTMLPSEEQGKQSQPRLPIVQKPSPAAGVQAYRVRITLQGVKTICWILPIHDELGLVARLYLGPRQDGASFTNEDMDLAHVCGQRILDTLRGHEAMLAVAGLLRRRIVDVKLLGAQQRRVLHDEILPQMHLALLRLETLHPLIEGKHEIITHKQAEEALNDTILTITDAHRRLAAMMRATATSAPHRLERDGMIHAIHTMIKQDFQQAFDEVHWDVSEETASRIDEMVPPAIAELIFAAVQEALRNSARHGRGADVHRRLHLTLTAACHPHLEVLVADDGVGILSASNSTTGTGGGLLTHSALLAIAGGSLTVKSAQGEGVTVRIMLPLTALR